jgi:peptidoglycan/xylan/chitin deacetylase (PgdA/CDA1 family)
MKILFASFTCLFALACSTDNEVTVIFRYDDYSAKSNTTLEVALIEVFRRHGFPLAIGVVPTIARNTNLPLPETENSLRPLTDEKFAILREAMADGTVEVALHGLTHQRIAADTKSEFQGRSYEDQLERIVRGKEFLEKGLNTKIRVFIPPWNSFDSETIRALEATELDILSSRIEHYEQDAGSLKHLPVLVTLQDLRPFIELMRVTPEVKLPVVVVMHAKDFGATPHWDLSELESSLRWIKDVGYVRGRHFADASELPILLPEPQSLD